MPRIKNEHTSVVSIRINEVVELILENPKYYQSKKSLELTNEVKNKYNVSSRQAMRYILGAKKAIADLVEQRKNESLETALMKLEFLYRKALNLYDYELALDVVKEENKIAIPEKKNINHTGEVALTFVEKLDE